MWASSILWTTAVSPFVSEILETQEISLLCRGIFSDQTSNPLWYSRITRYTVIIHQVLLNDIINTVLSLHKRSTVFSIDLADFFFTVNIGLIMFSFLPLLGSP